jgi:hypothetical protein
MNIGIVLEMVSRADADQRHGAARAAKSARALVRDGREKGKARTTRAFPRARGL